jgi:hypothetical protein
MVMVLSGVWLYINKLYSVQNIKLIRNSPNGSVVKGLKVERWKHKGES